MHVLSYANKGSLMQPGAQFYAALSISYRHLVQAKSLQTLNSADNAIAHFHIKRSLLAINGDTAYGNVGRYFS